MSQTDGERVRTFLSYIIGTGQAPLDGTCEDTPGPSVCEYMVKEGTELLALLAPDSPCPECKGTELVTVHEGGTPQRCMACYVHEEDKGESDFMKDPHWTMLTMNGAKAGFSLTRLSDDMVKVTVRRFGTS